MDGQLRRATSMEIVTALSALFTALPPRKGKFEDLIDGYQIALAGCSYEGLKTTVSRAIRGEVEALSQTFGPTPPELARAVREVDRHLEVINSPAAIPYTPKPFLSVEMRINAERQRMAGEGRTFICSVDTHGAAVEMAKRGKVPPGSVYSGMLGAFYSPPHWQAPATEPEGTDNEQRYPDDGLSVDAESLPSDGTPGIQTEPNSADWRQQFVAGS